MFENNLFTVILIPVLIFLARIVDVSIGTVRLIFISKGMKFLAPMLGFFEVLIWLVAIGQILQNLTNWVNYIAYAGGFAAGNFVGMVIESKIALGTVALRIITRHNADRLVSELRRRNFGVTSVDAEGRDGSVKIIFTLANRQEVPDIITIIKEYNPRAFYSIEDIRYASEGIFPLKKNSLFKPVFSHHRLPRKHK